LSDSGEETREQRLRRLRSRRPRLGPDQFNRLVARALRSLPQEFREKLENVAILVEDVPGPETLARMGMGPYDTLLGLYEGIPLTGRDQGYNLVLPDRITLFRLPILESCEKAEDVVREVRKTVIHEIAHFYGIDDEELDRMGYS